MSVEHNKQNITSALSVIQSVDEYTDDIYKRTGTDFTAEEANAYMDNIRFKAVADLRGMGFALQAVEVNTKGFDLAAALGALRIELKRQLKNLDVTSE